MFTLTLPKPHRGDRTLSPKYIGRIVQMVDLVEAYEEAESEED